MAINPEFEFKIASYSVLGVVAAWGITSVFLLGFRCQLSSPWSTNDKCLDEVSVYQGINIVNILTDLALIVLPAVMMWSVQTATRNKAIVIALFATRIL